MPAWAAPYDAAVQRVAIIGPGGAGKTTLALELGRRTDLPVVHLDRAYWRVGWVEPPGEDWARDHREALSGDAWIADGNYGSTMVERLAWTDTVVLMDPPPALCVARLARRQLRMLGRSRPDLPARLRRAARLRARSLLALRLALPAGPIAYRARPDPSVRRRSRRSAALERRRAPVSRLGRRRLAAWAWRSAAA